MTLHWLDINDPDAPFPQPEQALSEPNGLLAIGGDLSPARLLRAYRRGIFPWFNPDEPILWWSPDPRVIFELPGIRVSSRLQRRLRREDYAITLDRAFEQVIRHCAGPRRGQRGTWLGPQMISAYERLHRLGHAHSLEVWQKGFLIGGIYGIAIGGVFFGESMFSTARDASKIALVWLGRQLQEWGFELLDGQVGSPHLFNMGAVAVPREQFTARIQSLVKLPDRCSRWEVEIPAPRDTDHLPAG